MKKTRKLVTVQVTCFKGDRDKFGKVKIQQRVWNEREKNAAAKMAKDFADFLYSNATSDFWVALKKEMNKYRIV